jgi:hypothetical protein
MSKFGVSAFLCAGFVGIFAVGSAQANTYNLTLTDASNSSYSGTGTLVINGTPSPTNSYQDYCLGNSCSGGQLVSLSFTLDNGDVFSTSDSGLSNVNAVFDDGALASIGFGDNDSGYQLSIYSDLSYTYHFYSPQFQTTGTITAALAPAATPLPAALPLFAGGLGMVGFLARRRKRKALAA